MWNQPDPTDRIAEDTDWPAAVDPNAELEY